MKKEKRKMKKRVVSILLAMTMALGLAACGSDSGSSDESGSTGGTQSAAATESTGDTGSAIASYDDLTGKKIGVQLGTTGDIDYATPLEGQDGTTVERYNKGADAVQALKTGKIDCVIIDEQPANSFVAKNDDLMIVTEGMGDVEEYAICIAKDNTDLTDSFNQAIADLKEDGTLDSIVNNYIGDNVGETPYETPEGTEYPNGTLKMATNAEFEPYEYHDGDNIVGIDVDMATAICDKLGYKLEIEDMEFDAIITAVTSGKADFGAAGMTVTEDRLKNIDFTDPYTTASQVMIVMKNQ
jgi:polar amino acid transport system substrate-binding protein